MPNYDCELQLFLCMLSLRQPTLKATETDFHAISTLLLHSKLYWQTHHFTFVSLPNSSTRFKGSLLSLKSESAFSTHLSIFSCHYHAIAYCFLELPQHKVISHLSV